MYDKNHPIWKLADVLAAALVLTIILAFSAQRFDNTELEVIGWFTGLYITIQGGQLLMQRAKDFKNKG